VAISAARAATASIIGPVVPALVITRAASHRSLTASLPGPLPPGPVG
jgi:hypothetical protein